MLPELKDLVEKGLFTQVRVIAIKLLKSLLIPLLQKEVKAIIRKRTTFEIALVRRIAKKGDFLRYAAYEMQLEALRKKRLERLSGFVPPPSEIALPLMSEIAGQSYPRHPRRSLITPSSDGSSKYSSAR